MTGVATRACPWCGGMIPRPRAVYCSKSCYDFSRRAPAVALRVKAAITRRPRCLICDAPIHYGQTGVRYTARTCGDRLCVVRAYHWFGPVSRKARRRRYSRDWMRRRRASAA